jgi:hypothetical protein
LDFCAHKAGYDVVIERWKQGDYTEHLSVVRHPGDALLDYLQRYFIELQRKQAEEIDATQGKQPGDESLEDLNCGGVNRSASAKRKDSRRGGDPAADQSQWRPGAVTDS